MTGQQDETARAAGAVGVLGLLTLLNTLNFVDRQLLASFANFIVPELKLSNAQFAILTGPAFILFYALAGLAMGVVADMVHRGRLIAGAVGLWSVFTAASGMAVSFLSLLWPRALIGVGEAALTPAALSMLADRFPERRLGLVSGVYYAGVPIGAGLSLLLAGFAGPAIGWRACFFALGAAGLLLAITTFCIRDVRVSSRTTVRPQVRGVVDTFWRGLTGSPALMLVIAAGILLHGLIGSSVFDQLWLVRERGFERGSIAVTTGAIMVAAGLAGNLYGGVVSDHWRRRTGQSRLTLLVLTMLVLAPFVVALRVVAPDSPFFWLGVFASAFQLGAMYAPIFSTIQELSAPQVRSTTLAFSIFAMNVFGIGLGAYLCGVSIDVLTRARAPQPYTTVSLTMTTLSLLAIPLLWLASRRDAVAAAPA
ncbi:MAG: MFS transporter [Alphaproteobacteria bacterium]|nr:MFS transporter [Alphaproteobacteria bacterium]MBU1515638.1 MFS transporter [Alphaproteobacteria bacterium]MBU2094897.1 MFS transporter [Alphaproteobacteria bacterium]MBU2150929.1 MFS transporter [Alphaproteobacteria bacterium]MBU2305906.1 MFS transporter [Alphaproteobacteria bacterium]